MLNQFVSVVQYARKHKFMWNVNITHFMLTQFVSVVQYVANTNLCGM